VGHCVTVVNNSRIREVATFFLLKKVVATFSFEWNLDFFLVITKHDPELSGSFSVAVL
jgi:hypothetical protein